MSTRTRRRLLTAAMLTALTVTGCTSEGSVGSSGTVSLPAPTGRAAPPSTPVPASPTPVTPDGMVTGPGVSDTVINLAVLTSPALDRGFTQGVQLWQRSVNLSGGICGRTIGIVTASGDPVTAYDRLARSAIGFLDLTSGDVRSRLSDRAAADQVPVLAVTGSTTELTATGPVVLGATDDIKAINALSYMQSVGAVAESGTVGVLVGSGPGPANALAGARWWAARSGVTLDVRQADTAVLTGWGQASTVLALTDAATVGKLLRATPASMKVVTTLDGYAEQSFIASDKGRLLLSISTPAFGSDQPAAAAVARAFADAGLTGPGPRLLDGYALAAGWGRLLTRACADLALTRTGVRSAMTVVGAAGVDSLFGPSDPGLVVGQQLPATRVSSMALADPTAPAGISPLIWTQAAPGIADYVPER